MLWPPKYYKGLSNKKKTLRRSEIVARSKLSWKTAKAYRPFKTDKGVKTRKSSYSSRWHAKYPDAKSLKEIAKASGIPESTLKKVYNRGMAAWRTGHRPGASEHAWGMARVHSFVLHGKTWRTADADLHGGEDIRMEKGEYLREHHHLFNVLEHPTKKALKAELEKQKEELKERGLK